MKKIEFFVVRISSVVNGQISLLLKNKINGEPQILSVPIDKNINEEAQFIQQVEPD